MSPILWRSCGHHYILAMKITKQILLKAFDMRWTGTIGVKTHTKVSLFDDLPQHCIIFKASWDVVQVCTALQDPSSTTFLGFYINLLAKKTL